MRIGFAIPCKKRLRVGMPSILALGLRIWNAIISKRILMMPGLCIVCFQCSPLRSLPVVQPKGVKGVKFHPSRRSCGCIFDPSLQSGGGGIPPRLCRKLSAVARRARRRWKAHVKTHLMHVLHYKIKVTCKVRLKEKNTIFAFWAVESVRWAAKSSN